MALITPQKKFKSDPTVVIEFSPEVDAHVIAEGTYGVCYIRLNAPSKDSALYVLQGANISKKGGVSGATTLYREFLNSLERESGLKVNYRKNNSASVQFSERVTDILSLRLSELIEEFRVLHQGHGKVALTKSSIYGFVASGYALPDLETIITSSKTKAGHTLVNCCTISPATGIPVGSYIIKPSITEKSPTTELVAALLLLPNINDEERNSVFSFWDARCNGGATALIEQAQDLANEGFALQQGKDLVLKMNEVDREVFAALSEPTES